MILNNGDSQSKLNSKRNRYFWFLGLSAIFALLIFHLNRLTLFTSDDYTYHFVYQGYLPTAHPKRINGLFSIVKSQINHWQLWNGRFVAHSIVQFFLQFKKVYFDVFNTLAYLTLSCQMRYSLRFAFVIYIFMVLSSRNREICSMGLWFRKLFMD